MTKNGPEFLIGWRDFPLEKDDTWEPKFDEVVTMLNDNESFEVTCKLCLMRTDK